MEHHISGVVESITVYPASKTYRLSLAELGTFAIGITPPGQFWNDCPVEPQDLPAMLMQAPGAVKATIYRNAEEYDRITKVEFIG